MTVGEPEINLNTWGLRYVRKDKKESQSDLSAFGNTKIGQGTDYNDTPKKENTFTDSTGKEQKTTPTGGKVHEDRVDTVTSYGSGSSQVEHGSDKRSFSSEGKVELASGQNIPEKPKPHKDQSVTTHGSGKQDSLTRTGKPAEGAHVRSHGADASSKPTGRTRDEKGTRIKQPTHEEGALPKTKAELDLTIIKCKLLKLKGYGGTERTTASHGYGSRNRYGSENTGSASAGVDTSKLEKKPQDKTDTSNTQHSTAEGVDISPEEYKQGGDKVTDPHYSAERGQSFGDQASKVRGSKKSEDENTCTSCGKPKDDHYSEWGHARREHGDQKESIGDHMYKKSEDEIVHKAIELINQAYNGLEKKGEWDNVVKPSKRDDDEKTKGFGGTESTTEKPFGKVLDEEGRPDEYTKEEHAEHESQKD